MKKKSPTGEVPDTNLVSGGFEQASDTGRVWLPLYGGDLSMTNISAGTPMA